MLDGKLEIFSNLDTKIPKLIIWNVNPNIRIGYEEFGENVVRISGFSLEIFNYLLVYGDFNPHVSISQLLQNFSE